MTVKPALSVTRFLLAYVLPLQVCLIFIQPFNEGAFCRGFVNQEVVVEMTLGRLLAWAHTELTKRSFKDI